MWVGAASERTRGAAPPLRAIARDLPAEAFRPGPGGVPVAGEALAAAVSSIVSAAGVKIPAASLVVPDSFTRTSILDLPDAATTDREIEEMAAWKASRSFGEPAPAVRLAWQRAGGAPAGGIRILAVAAPAEAADSWEESFAAAGIRLGSVEPASLAAWWAARRALGPDGFYVWSEGGTATVAFLRAGELVFLRSRPSSDALEALQEIRLSAAFAEGTAGTTGASTTTGSVETPSSGEATPGGAGLFGACAAGPAGDAVVEALRAARREAGAPEPVALSRAALLPEAMPTGLPGDDPAVFLALAATAAVP